MEPESLAGRPACLEILKHGQTQEQVATHVMLVKVQE